MGDDSLEKKKFDWRLILILGIIFVLFFLIRFDFISVRIGVILIPIIIVLLILLHTPILRYRSLSVAMNDRTKKILFSLMGFFIFIKGMGIVRNPQTLSWVIKLLPGNVDLWKYIFENFIRGIIYILLGIFFTVVPWLTMWGARKKISAMALSFLFIFLGVDYVFMYWDSSEGLRNLFSSMSGLLCIFIGSLLMFIFRRSPKSIENLP
jgi:hypothetical protein